MGFDKLSPNALKPFALFAQRLLWSNLSLAQPAQRA
jgi:hypothetical protein